MNPYAGRDVRDLLDWLSRLDTLQSMGQQYREMLVLFSKGAEEAISPDDFPWLDDMLAEIDARMAAIKDALEDTLGSREDFWAEQPRESWR